ncbi:MAG TPA: family 78 glycoside hydrolase catalytic domain, partial [Ktedonobacteraceae bacterium]|nr:family 78 glycoside hydrolase catalytic domain [Ktedonobacteraceae bacterium]
KPSAALLHISADSRYGLFLNGKRLGTGPARAFHFHYEYDTYEITEHLTPGVNLVAVQVQHWGEATFQHQVGRGGLLLEIEDTGNGAILLASDANWRVWHTRAYRQNTPRIACQLPWEEQFDARLHPEGWQISTFADSHWPEAQEIGSVGCAPWGTLAPRTIPFLTDEPCEPVQSWSCGVFQRPEVVAAVHLLPSLAPGDQSANQHPIDAVLAARLCAPRAGNVTLKLCSLYSNGTEPVLWIDGVKLPWQPSAVDREAHLFLEAGEHLLLLDWQGETHDTDLTMTARGIPGLRLISLPFVDQQTGQLWALTLQPGEKREQLHAATSSLDLQTCAVPWQTVAEHDTPPVDVYMEMTASVALVAERLPVSFPPTIPPAGEQQARRYLLDFGRELIGWLEWEVEAEEGAVLDMLGFEGIQDGELLMTELMNNTLRYTCRAGRQVYRSHLRRGFRYLLLSVHSTPAPLTVFSLRTALATYPGPARGSFSCSDERLTRIWQMCTDTLRLCTEDTFTDCPTYEQTFWVGDSYIDTLVHTAVHGDMRIVERCLRLCADSLRISPLVPSQLPRGWEHILPNWSWFWMLSCYEYYQISGKRSFVRDLYPALRQQAAFIEQARESHGLFTTPAWHFLEWSRLDEGPDYLMAHESMLACAALKKTAALAAVAEQAQDEQRWLQTARELQNAIHRAFWSEQEHAFVDSLHSDGTPSSVFSQSTNVCALFADLLTGEQRTHLLTTLAHPPANWVRFGTPWLYSFYLRELAREQRSEEMLALMREHWGAMLDKGATTAWETFPGWEINGHWTRSWCHAWSSLPAYLLSSNVLGIRPATPGFAHAIIAPQLAWLSWVRGTLPTPHGEIALQAKRTGQGLLVEIALPATITARVELPREDAGRRYSTSAILGPYETMAQEERSWTINLPAGAHTTITLS